MNFDLEDILDSAKEKAVEAATEKFGARATPIAEEVADKCEQTLAGKMRISLNTQNDKSSDNTDTGNSSDNTDNS